MVFDKLPQGLWEAGFFILGAIVGSFLNVCIARWPHERSVCTGRSQCQACGATIAWYDNIPLISYWSLRGRCRRCGARFSIRYFWVELITALVFWLTFRHYGFDPRLWAYLLLFCGFIVATFVDFEHRIIPDEVTLNGCLAGLVLSFLIPSLQGVAEASWTAREWALGRSCLGMLIGGGLMYGMGVLGELIFKKEALGGGDVKLMAMIGAFLGWKVALLAFFIAPLFGAVYGVIEKIRTKESTIPYGPFLVLGTLVAFFWQDQILTWLFPLYSP